MVRADWLGDVSGASRGVSVAMVEVTFNWLGIALVGAMLVIVFIVVQTWWKQ